MPTHPKGWAYVQYPFADQLKKFALEWRIGGLFNAINRLRMMNHLRMGRFVGEDTNGNKYYENTNVAYGRSRWVEPRVPLVAFEMDKYYDSSQVSCSTSEHTPWESQRHTQSWLQDAERAPLHTLSPGSPMLSVC